MCLKIESNKTGAIEIRLEFEPRKNAPTAASAFCLLNGKLVNTDV